jgi:hypothetical protein
LIRFSCCGPKQLFRNARQAGSNLFHQGIAKETDDPAVVAETMSKPGVVLVRKFHSHTRFLEAMQFGRS